MTQLDLVNTINNKLNDTISKAAIKNVLDAASDVLFAELKAGVKVSVIACDDGFHIEVNTEALSN